jgi:hypothetical protein
MGLAPSRTASQAKPVAARTRFRASGLIKGLRGLVWLGSRLGTDANKERKSGVDKVANEP